MLHHLKNGFVKITKREPRFRLMILALNRLRMIGPMDINVLNNAFNNDLRIWWATEDFKNGLVELIEKTLDSIIGCARFQWWDLDPLSWANRFSTLPVLSF